MRSTVNPVLTGVFVFLVTCLAQLTQASDSIVLREKIQAMKEADRGPFRQIRWFCKDGSVLPPQNYGCKENGGGFQHGEWSSTTLEFRSQGYWIANILAGMDSSSWLASGDFHEQLPQILIEKFLMGADDGWIMRRAQFYRGAIQEEDERWAARQLLLRMAGLSQWTGPRFLELRVAARMLPHGTNTASIQEVRQLSATLSDKDSGFKAIRAKIHGAPGAEDAASVRAYAQGVSDETDRQTYLQLADEIDRIYQAQPLAEELELLAEKYTAGPWLQQLLRDHAQQLHEAETAEQEFIITAALLAELRNALPRINSPYARVEILDLSLRVEGENFRAAAELRPIVAQGTRQQHIAWLTAASRAAYGTGLLNARLLDELEFQLKDLSRDSMSLAEYLSAIELLSRTPGWGTQSLRMFFFEAMQKLAEIEPLAMLFIQDQLRGSPLLFYSSLLDSLSRDANRLAGITHSLFGEPVGTGFKALNPGLAQGILHTRPDLDKLESFQSNGIYLLPETISELPPVAGILTGGEGNPLSHVQLLARNLGIPNVTVETTIADKLAAYEGQHIVMAVSRSGLVEIAAWSDLWNEIFQTGNTADNVVITPDLEKLDLEVRQLLPLQELRADDSGRVVGPKAAKLGELGSHYPQQVARGLAIPFGVFYQEVLLQAHPSGQGSLFDWMVSSYQKLAAMPGNSPELDAERKAATESFRAELHSIIQETQPSDNFKVQLQRMLEQVFGSEQLPGMFIRSDTNVEDLAGFTGAGLNLTLPNVIGFDNLLRGMVEVWASPFTARAFAWRQALMTQPEHVYTSILLLESVASDKSGVLVTQDIDTGNPDVISVAVNEGVGGAVDGQAAESLRIPLDGSRVSVLATATAPWRRVPNPLGGLQYLPSSGSDWVLQSDEINQLIGFARQLPENFPPITDDEGQPAPADVEFGFVNGELKLFQIRPFLDSKQARGITYLQQMELRVVDQGVLQVDMTAVPEQ